MPVAPATKLQFPEELKLPVPLETNATDPVGVVAPEVEVSVTVAVQEVDCPITTGEGMQATVVIVGFTATEIVKGAELTAWAKSPL